MQAIGSFGLAHTICSGSRPDLHLRPRKRQFGFYWCHVFGVHRVSKGAVEVVERRIAHLEQKSKRGDKGHSGSGLACSP
eukprot:scaffold320561_cov45-Tisochrysis_lutea.AAC.1